MGSTRYTVYDDNRIFRALVSYTAEWSYNHMKKAFYSLILALGTMMQGIAGDTPSDPYEQYEAMMEALY